MKHSTNGILTTHVGALVQPQDLYDLHKAKEKGQPVDAEKFATRVRQAVQDIVKLQADNGVTVVNDGEQGKSSWTAYVKDRISGFSPDTSPRAPALDAREFPEYFAKRRAPALTRYAATGPLAWRDFGAVQTDIDNLRAAIRNVKVEDGFITAVSPGQIANTNGNQYYKDKDEFMHALAGLMKQEYDAIGKSGFVLQVDCPEFALGTSHMPDMTHAEYRKVVAAHIETLNHATRDIPAENIRVHVCWGRGEGPKHHDAPLKDIVDLLLKARCGALSIVGSNGRHEYEWKVWKDQKIQPGKMLIPGVVDNTTNIIEHPEVVSDRLLKYASIVGRENVMGGTDCGFGNEPLGGDVDPRIAWAKLKSGAEGAALATKELWKK